MITLTSFYPFSNFLRVTQEFHDDKVIVKTKSLTFEQETEFAYNKVAEISVSYYSYGDQRFLFFLLVTLIGITFNFFCNVIYGNFVLLQIAQLLFISGLLLFVTSFIKSWHIILSDKDDNVLAVIKQTRSNREMILRVTEMIKRKSENIQEITAADPFPKSKPAYEHIYYDFSALMKTTDRFYNNEIIGFEKNLFIEKAYVVKYNALNGKLYQGKIGNKIWEPVLPITMFVFSVMFGIDRGFVTLPKVIFLYFAYTFSVILLISWLLSFVKRDTIGLYDHNGKVIYWTYVNQANKEKFEEIIKFVQSRIPPENKELPLKEKP